MKIILVNAEITIISTIIFDEFIDSLSISQTKKNKTLCFNAMLLSSNILLMTPKNLHGWQTAEVNFNFRIILGEFGKGWRGNLKVATEPSETHPYRGE